MLMFRHARAPCSPSSVLKSSMLWVSGNDAYVPHQLDKFLSLLLLDDWTPTSYTFWLLLAHSVDSHYALSAMAAKPRTRTNHSSLSKHATAGGRKQETIHSNMTNVYYEGNNKPIIVRFSLFVFRVEILFERTMQVHPLFRLWIERIGKFVVYKIESIRSNTLFILLMRFVFFNLRSLDVLCLELPGGAPTWIGIHK